MVILACPNLKNLTLSLDFIRQAQPLKKYQTY